MTPPELELRAGDLRLALRPDLGGAVAGLWLRELPVLRSTEPADLTAARKSASYPLVPYSNRVGQRRFRWLGQDYTTAQNFDDNPHSLHGVAWQRPWQVMQSDAGQVELGYAHAPDAHWPFAFAVRQRFVLSPTALEVHLSFTNRAGHPQPVGLGWHPYFPKRAHSSLHIELTERWDSDPSGLPSGRVPQPGIDAAVADLALDNCFEGWTGPARIRDDVMSLRLTSSLSYLVVYTPATQPYFCVEPVSHVSNAIQMADPGAHGLRALDAGATFDAWMKIEVAAT
jgi:aldose 1-epimerase